MTTEPINITANLISCSDGRVIIGSVEDNGGVIVSAESESEAKLKFERFVELKYAVHKLRTVAEAITEMEQEKRRSRYKTLTSSKLDFNYNAIAF